MFAEYIFVFILFDLYFTHSIVIFYYLIILYKCTVFKNFYIL